MRYIGRKLFVFMLSLVMALSMTVVSYAEEAGTYHLDGEFSAYLAAMGGVEFGGPLLEDLFLIVDEDGQEFLQMVLTKSSVTIYSITCDTFVDVSPSTVTTTRGIEDGTIGIYDADGNLITDGVEYTLSEDTALNSADEEVYYVDSVTLPISERMDEYSVAMYINSNVMGVEFCNENEAATETTYAATLTVDWSTLTAVDAAAEDETSETDEDTDDENEEETEEESGEEEILSETLTNDDEDEAEGDSSSDESSLEGNDDLEGLTIYNADSDEEDIEEVILDDETEDESVSEDAAAEEASASKDESSNAVVTIAVVLVVIVVLTAGIFFAVNQKNHKQENAALEENETDEAEDEKE